MANSRNVQARIWAHYGRESVVIHPPVDTQFFRLDPHRARESYFLYVGQLTSYKRPEDLVALARAGFTPLKVVGTGGAARRVQRSAQGYPIEFLGRVDDHQLRWLLQGARGLLFPGLEDFGMVPVEAMACGTPVVALDEGGARETVVPGMTGTRYGEGQFDTAFGVFCEMESDFDANQIRAHAEQFGRERFRSEFSTVLTAESGLDIAPEH